MERFIITYRWSDGLPVTREVFGLTEAQTEVANLIRQHGTDKVTVYSTTKGELLTFSDLELDIEAIESDRYPELFIEIHNSYARIYRDSNSSNRHLLTIPVSDLPERLQDPNDMTDLYQYVKSTYDDSLIDTYYLQK